MFRAVGSLLLLALLASAGGPGKHVLRAHFRANDRYTVSTTVSYNLKTTTRRGTHEETSRESVQRTEEFLDEVKLPGDGGLLKIERTYLRLYLKTKTDKDARPVVIQNPLTAHKVILTESHHHRDLELEGPGTIDPLVRRTAGMEIDWRDILPEGAVGPGDSWDAEAGQLARRASAYLESGSRTNMKVRYESDIRYKGAQCAKFYIDWTIQGMRDRHLFTKVTLAGDVYFDRAAGRVVHVDLGGSYAVQGALVGKDLPEIIQGNGTVQLKTDLKPAPLQAAAPGTTKAPGQG